MFNEFQLEKLIGSIQEIDSLNFLDYEVQNNKQFTFFISTEDDVFDYIGIIMQIMLRYDLITLAVHEENDENLVFETVTFNRFGVN